MAFKPTASKIPDAVSMVQVVLTVRPGDPDNTYEARFSFDVVDAAGDVIDVQDGDLVPHLTDTQRQHAMAFMDDMLSKAEAEAVGGGG